MSPEEAPLRSPLGERSRKAHILNVARHLWAQRSYHGVSLRRIADEAGVALALIDHYFGTKHLLFGQTLEPLTAACDRAAASLQALAPGSSEDRGNAMLRALCETVGTLSQQRQGRDVLRLWLMHRHDTMPEVRAPTQQAIQSLMEVAVHLLGEYWPAAPASLAPPSPTVIFGAVVDMAVGAAESTFAPCHNSDEAPPFSVESVLVLMTAALKAGSRFSPCRPA